MSFEYPDNLKYMDSHEYVRLEGDVATVGITAFAIDQLGDIVFIELPEVGDELSQGETMGNIESVKAVEDIYAPINGTVLECNTAIADAPEQLAEDPYNNGWLLKIKVSGPAALDKAMSASDYQAKVEG
ncbi:glycine cleavage system protein GcvH [Acaryochloris marina]|uniref:Glycine cleavage system H protein n=1 Tax=Acaryochloris marina (strain MBIC 11017) TaxID=329726 RepID=GCSH_ACAM1|nr:glycine cleavage system protein GcvH [Acaryochloris marina]B0C921.1 RecName: Full=Glycine cleavage system H protein [Acaryochloris marina MBIC11017]ABW26556.1 glycine cleavage system H protein [Acaryochloris marina MBIC11017]BDM81357.1 glycine cleavage system H protein [Acaryochloris marina MBIC10699]